MSIRIVDKSKSLPELYKTLAIEAELEEPETPLLPPPTVAPANDDKSDCELPPSNTTSSPETVIREITDDFKFKDDDIPFEVDDDIWDHKLGEAVLPLKLLQPFLALFPNDRAYSQAQIANKKGEIYTNIRHITVYDTYENLKKYSNRG